MHVPGWKLERRFPVSERLGGSGSSLNTIQELTNNCLWSGVRCAAAASGSYQEVHVAEEHLEKSFGEYFFFFVAENPSEQTDSIVMPPAQKSGSLNKELFLYTGS